MTRHTYALAIAITLVAVPFDLAPTKAQPANHLHGVDETPDQAARRTQHRNV